MPNDAVVFSRGLAATMPTSYIEGRFLLQTDTGALFLDDTASSRIQIKDTTKLPLTGGTMTGDIDFHDTLSGIKFSVGTGQYSSSAGIHLTSTTPLDTALTIEYDSGITSITMDQNIVDIFVGPQPNGRSRLVLSDGNYGAPSATFSSYAAGSNDPQPLKVTGIAIPTNSNDATNKQYVDGLYQNLESEIVTTAAQYLPLKGGTMAGDINFVANGSDSTELHFLHQQSQSSGYMRVSYSSDALVTNWGGCSIEMLTNATIVTAPSTVTIKTLNEGAATLFIDGINSYAQFYNGMTGTPLRVTGILTPTSANDAANKEYVDNKVGSISTLTSNLLFATTSSNPDGTESPPRLKLSIPGYTGGQTPASGTYLWVLSTNGFNASIAPGFEINDSGSVITVDYTTNTGAMPLKAPNTMALFSSDGTSFKLIGTIFQIDEGTLS